MTERLLISLLGVSWSRDSDSGYRLHDQEVEVPVPVGARIFFSPRLPDRLWGPPSLYAMGTKGSYPGGKAATA
jgi:hypothetical protein